MLQKLLSELGYETYVMLKASPVHGIGVFAIRNIPKGTRNIFSKGMGEWIKVPITKVEALPEHTRSLIEHYSWPGISSELRSFGGRDGIV